MLQYNTAAVGLVMPVVQLVPRLNICMCIEFNSLASLKYIAMTHCCPLHAAVSCGQREHGTELARHPLLWTSATTYCCTTVAAEYDVVSKRGVVVCECVGHVMCRDHCSTLCGTALAKLARQFYDDQTTAACGARVPFMPQSAMRRYIIVVGAPCDRARGDIYIYAIG